MSKQLRIQICEKNVQDSLKNRKINTAHKTDQTINHHYMSCGGCRIMQITDPHLTPHIHTHTHTHTHTPQINMRERTSITSSTALGHEPVENMWSVTHKQSMTMARET